MVQRIRTSRVNGSNERTIHQLKLKIQHTINKVSAGIIANPEHKIGNKLDRSKQQKDAALTRPPRNSSKRRMEKKEAIYAEPVPRQNRGQLSAEENLQQWGSRRGLPINKIRIIAAELRKGAKQQQQQ